MINEYCRISREDKELYKKILDGLLSYGPVIVVENRGLYECVEAYNRVLWDHAELFWLHGVKCESHTTVNRVTVFLEPIVWENLSLADAPAMSAELNAVVKKVAAEAEGLDIYSKILYVHDYIVDNTDYVFTPNCYNAYGCLVEHKAVCAGFACAFQLILNRLNITCGRVLGSSIKDEEEDNHEWNYCMIGQKYYFVDVTWDNPSFSGENKKYKTHEFFCLSSRDLNRTHRIKKLDFFLPDCKSNEHNYYVYKNLYVGFYSFERVSQFIKTQLRTSNEITLKFAVKSETDAAIKDLIIGNKIFTLNPTASSVNYHISKSGLILTVEFIGERPNQSVNSVRRSDSRFKVIKKQ